MVLGRRHRGDAADPRDPPLVPGGSRVFWFSRSRVSGRASGQETPALDYSAVNGSRAISRARLTAAATHRWCRAQVPVVRRGRILPRSEVDRFSFATFL